MDCPACGVELKRGRLAVRNRPFAPLVFPLIDRSQIHFVPADGSDEIELDRCQDSFALTCESCGRVMLDLRRKGPDIRTVPDDRSEEAPCLSCQGIIPPGADTCPECGWSYNGNNADIDE